MDPIVGRVGVLLVQRIVVIGAADLIPAYAGDIRFDFYGLVGYERLIILKAAIGKAPGWPRPVREYIQDGREDLVSFTRSGFRQ
jgi:hypothetical protein